MNKLLEVKGLTYKKNLRTILKDVNLDVESGKIIALLGENGAGKTTLMRVIVAIAKHYQGKVLLNGDGSEVYRKANIAMTDNLKGLSDSTKVGELTQCQEKGLLIPFCFGKVLIAQLLFLITL